jgi:FAD synthetase
LKTFKTKLDFAIAMTRVLVFGTFDILHPGHEYFLKQAKKQGDELVVVVARDSTVKQVKGEQPHHDENFRLSNIQNLDYVDKAMLGYESADKYRIIDEIRPDIICLGYDQTHFVNGLESKLQEMGLKPELIRIGSYEPHIHKSSHYRTLKKQN